MLHVTTPAPGLTCVRAPNPSPLTAEGTNTWLVEEDDLSLIDPGPDLPAHLAALMAALAGRPLARIVVTHAHMDHSALAPRLSALTGAPVLAFGDARAGRSPRAAALDGVLPEGEGCNLAFRPDALLADGASAGPFRALHTPGHMGNHIALVWRDTVFTGDTVMGWATSIVAPPEGDMGQYMDSLARLAALGASTAWPGHGAPVTDPAARIAALTAHRRTREAAILQALAFGPQDVPALTARVYADTSPHLHAAAARNVLAHLLDLERQMLATPLGPPHPETPWVRL